MLLCAQILNVERVVIMCAAHVYTVILAGGKGKRLWPLSRHTLPKQLIPFFKNKTLLDFTIERAALLTDYSRCGIVTVDNYLPMMKTATQKLGFIIKEPYQRNTAAAITLTAAELYARDPHAIIFFMPSDHLITDTSQFVHVAEQAITHADLYNDLVLLGIKPTYPATDYGYIEYITANHEPVHVLRFHEKPSKESAEKYYTLASMVWNSGMLCVRAANLLEAVKRYAPVIYQGVQEYRQGHEDAYAVLPDCSFDHAVLEYAENMVLFPANFGWSDVGNLTTFLAAYRGKDDNNSVIEFEAHNNMIYSKIEKKAVVLLGVDDLCVVDMDDILFITSRRESDKVKSVVEYLQKYGYSKYL